MSKWVPATVCIAMGCLLAETGALSAAPYRFDDLASEWGPPESVPMWLEMRQQHRAEYGLTHACLQSHADCPYYLKGLRLIVRRADGVSDYGKLLLTNRFINRKKWVKDRADGQPSDEWLPLASFLRDGGDCEDFAIAKYLMLIELGINADRMRVVVTWDRREKASHALLAVDLGGTAYLLDTDDNIYRGHQRHNYLHIYSINDFGVWHHPTDPDLIPGEPVASNERRGL